MYTFSKRCTLKKRKLHIRQFWCLVNKNNYSLKICIAYVIEAVGPLWAVLELDYPRSVVS